MAYTGVGVPNKRAVQSSIYSRIENKQRIIGLGGPNIAGYVELLRKHHFKEIILFENDVREFVAQIQQYDGRYSLRLGNILHNLYMDGFYELDFCKSIIDIETFLPAIFNLRQFSLTVSIRPFKPEKTLGILHHYANGREFIELPYRDSSNMLTILKT